MNPVVLDKFTTSSTIDFFACSTIVKRLKSVLKVVGGIFLCLNSSALKSSLYEADSVTIESICLMERSVASDRIDSICFKSWFLSRIDRSEERRVGKECRSR